MVTDVLEAVLKASLAGSLGVLIALALRDAARRVFGPRVAYALWAIAPLMAAASLIPAPDALSFALPAIGQITPRTADTILLLWLLGAATLAGGLLFTHARFLRALGKPSLDASGLPILRARDDKMIGPAVIGAIGAKIVLPADFEARYSETERAMVLAHERGHLFGHDPQAIALAAMMRCLNWFNPLAHIGGYWLRIDQELACDAAVLAQYPKARRTYAEALLKTQLAGAAPAFGCQWPARGQSPLEERIALLAAPEPGRRRKAAGAGLVAVVALAASALAWAAEPAPVVERPPVNFQLWAMLKNDVSLLSRVRPMTLAPGQTFSRVYEPEEDQFYFVTLTPTLRKSGEIVIDAAVEHDGKIVGRSAVTLEEGEPRFIRVGSRNLLMTAKVAPSDGRSESANRTGPG